MWLDSLKTTTSTSSPMLHLYNKLSPDQRYSSIRFHLPHCWFSVHFQFYNPVRYFIRLHLTRPLSPFHLSIQHQPILPECFGPSCSLRRLLFFPSLLHCQVVAVAHSRATVERRKEAIMANPPSTWLGLVLLPDTSPLLPKPYHPVPHVGILTVYSGGLLNLDILNIGSDNAGNGGVANSGHALGGGAGCGAGEGGDAYTGT